MKTKYRSNFLQRQIKQKKNSISKILNFIHITVKEYKIMDGDVLEDAFKAFLKKLLNKY